MWHSNCNIFKSLDGLCEKKRLAMNNSKILQNDVLLNLVSHKVVAWTFIKLFSACKYAGLFV